VEGISEFLSTNNIQEALERADTRLAIELGASVCGTNLNPDVLVKIVCRDRIGYCVDLAHTPATGCPGEKWRKLIEEIPPVIAHINFCGADIGSSQDNHGWRTMPEMVKRKRKIVERSMTETTLFTKEHDLMLQLLASKDIPLIVEGSGFPLGNIYLEIEKVREILG
jgi:hypothetical protein